SGDGVRVRVIETGDGGAAAKVDHAGGRPPQSQEILGGAYGQHLASPQGRGFGRPPGGTASPNAAVHQDEVGFHRWVSHVLIIPFSRSRVGGDQAKEAT